MKHTSYYGDKTLPRPECFLLKQEQYTRRELELMQDIEDCRTKTDREVLQLKLTTHRMKMEREGYVTQEATRPYMGTPLISGATVCGKRENETVCISTGYSYQEIKPDALNRHGYALYACSLTLIIGTLIHTFGA